MVYTIEMLKEKYRDYANPLDKIKRDADRGILIRLKNGIYETERDVRSCLLAPVILSPSYLSFEWALSYYGFIPERVEAITSASFRQRKNKTFENAFGRYEFSDIPTDVFPQGLTLLIEGGRGVRIASKEKAICDCLYKWPVVRSVKALKELLFEDKRIDEDEFATCDFALMLRLAAQYQKINLQQLSKLIRKEYLHE